MYKNLSSIKYQVENIGTCDIKCGEAQGSYSSSESVTLVQQLIRPAIDLWSCSPKLNLITSMAMFHSGDESLQQLV